MTQPPRRRVIQSRSTTGVDRRPEDRGRIDRILVTQCEVCRAIIVGDMGRTCARCKCTRLAERPKVLHSVKPGTAIVVNNGVLEISQP